MRYLKSHDKRGKPNPPSGKRLDQITEARVRHAEVIEEYRRGLPLDEIAQRHGLAEASSVGWIVARARMSGEAIPRRNAEARPPLDDATAREFARMWRAGHTASEIRAAFGWTRQELHSVVTSVRRHKDVPLRTQRPPELSRSEQKALKRAALKVAPRAGLSDRQRTVLRLLQASDRPVSSVAIAETMCLLGYAYSRSAAQGALSSLRRKGLISRVAPEAAYRHAPRWLWFVPFDKEQPARSLTLADARRETELAALLREQEADAARGNWAETDFRTTSLDAERGEGATLYDFIEDAA